MADKGKQQQLDEIREKILRDKVTPKLKATATQLVFGDGNPDADILFIGEAPGKNEDQQGLPFVGAAGKFLNEMLEMVDLKRQDVYITNIVKYRPPNNRDPLPDEKAAFLPYLQAQLEVIQPKVVVTLGRHSMNCFLPDLQISKIHGQPKRIRINMRMAAERIKEGETAVSPESSHGMAIVILPLFHPAAALYNGGMRQTLIDDFARIPVVIEKIDDDPSSK
jgi:uracil-DNA glycosylase family 4